jgi:hypothetical protein
MNAPTPEDLAAAEAQAQQQMSPAEMLAMVDNDDSALPQLNWVPSPAFWRFENWQDPTGEPAVIIVLSNTNIPNGVPWVLSRDRALLFASQLKKRCNTGPEIIAPPTGLIVPGR